MTRSSSIQRMTALGDQPVPVERRVHLDGGVIQARCDGIADEARDVLAAMDDSPGADLGDELDILVEEVGKLVEGPARHGRKPAAGKPLARRLVGCGGDRMAVCAAAGRPGRAFGKEVRGYPSGPTQSTRRRQCRQSRHRNSSSSTSSRTCTTRRRRLRRCCRSSPKRRATASCRGHSPRISSRRRSTSPTSRRSFDRSARGRRQLPAPGSRASRRSTTSSSSRRTRAPRCSTRSSRERRPAPSTTRSPRTRAS